MDTSSLRDHWSRQLKRYSWDHSFTGTFRFPCSSDFALRRFATFAGSFTAQTQGPIPYFVVTEPTLTDQVHVHALLRGTRAITTRALEARWHLRNGYAEAALFDPLGTMTAYVTKRLTSQRSEWDLSPSFSRAMAKLDRRIETHTVRQELREALGGPG